MSVLHRARRALLALLVLGGGVALTPARADAELPDNYEVMMFVTQATIEYDGDAGYGGGCGEWRYAKVVASSYDEATPVSGKGYLDFGDWKSAHAVQSVCEDTTYDLQWDVKYGMHLNAVRLTADIQRKVTFTFTADEVDPLSTKHVTAWITAYMPAPGTAKAYTVDFGSMIGQAEIVLMTSKHPVG